MCKLKLLHLCQNFTRLGGGGVGKGEGEWGF
jgi:hypothetical protein